MVQRLQKLHGGLQLRLHIARHDARTRLQNGTLQIGALGKELVVQSTTRDDLVDLNEVVAR